MYRFYLTRVSSPWSALARSEPPENLFVLQTILHASALPFNHMRYVFSALRLVLYLFFILLFLYSRPLVLQHTHSLALTEHLAHYTLSHHTSHSSGTGGDNLNDAMPKASVPPFPPSHPQISLQRFRQSNNKTPPLDSTLDSFHSFITSHQSTILSNETPPTLSQPLHLGTPQPLPPPTPRFSRDKCLSHFLPTP